MSSVNERDRSVIMVRKLIREIARDTDSKPEASRWLPFLKNAEVISLNRTVSPLEQLKSTWSQLAAISRKQMVVERLTIEMKSDCEIFLDKSMSQSERSQILALANDNAALTITVQGEIGGASISIEKGKKQMLKDALQKTAIAVFVATQVESGLSALLQSKPEDETKESLVVVGKTRGKIVWERTWYKLSLTDRIRTRVPKISEYDIFWETPIKASKD